MRAKYTGHCSSCDEPIEIGSDISKLLGEYMHTPCKGRELERKRLLATVKQLPDARGAADQKKQISSRGLRRRPVDTTLPSVVGQGRGL